MNEVDWRHMVFQHNHFSENPEQKKKIFDELEKVVKVINNLLDGVGAEEDLAESQSQPQK